MKKVDLVVDMQYGSTGKGLLAGYLAETREHDTVINANMPNAGHTYINEFGRKWMHKVLPNGIVSPELKTVMIGAGSIFDPDVLYREIEESYDILAGKKILIHPMAGIVSDDHRDVEKATMSKISSTAQGSGACMVEKIMRQVDRPVVARDVLEEYPYDDFPEVKVCSIGEWNEALAVANKILAEGAQGYSLGLNQMFYPYVTSRDCTPARFLADMGIPLPMLNEVIGVARCHPIRVGGTSGPCYNDQIELSWEQLGQPEELTTVTKKVRRVFTFSDAQIRDAQFGIQPDWIFLNFCNYLEQPGYDDVAHRIDVAGNDMCGEGKGQVRLMGFGPAFQDLVERHGK